MPSKSSKNTTRTRTKPIVFSADDLLASLRSHIQHLSGKKKLTLRTRTIYMPDRITGMKASEITAIRSKLKLSQPIFARVLNVPVATARSWETGRRKPTGAALRLLDLARRSPQTLLDLS
jgi:putative transcriptional regulator